MEIRSLVKTHNKATFSPIQYCRPVEGGLYPGGLIIRFFFFPVGRPITGGGLISGEGGYNRNFTVCILMFLSTGNVNYSATQ